MNSSALTNTVTSTLFWCHSGTAIVNAPDRIISVLAGDLVIAPAGAFITSSGAAGHDRGATGVVIPISFPGMKITGATRRMHLGQVWSDRMISEYSRSMLGESELSADIMKLFDDRAKPPKMPTAPAALAVAKQLQANPADPTSLIDFAKRQHVSSRTLQRQFQATTDYTFSEWRAAYRVSVAADLLSHQLTITNVASMVGFDATSSLTRAFKRHTGTTPSSFTTGAVGMGAAGVAPQIPPLTTFARAETDQVLWIYRGTATVTTAGYCRFMGAGETVTIPAGTDTRLDIAAGSIALPVPVNFDERNGTVDWALVFGMCEMTTPFAALEETERKLAEKDLIPTI